MIRTLRAGALTAIAIVLSLTACAGGGEDATPSPSVAIASQSPAVEVDPLETVAVVLVRPDHLDLRDDSNATVQTLSYDLNAEVMVAALTTVFDADPEVEESVPPCCEGGAATLYRWDGFEVSDDIMGHYDDENPAEWVPEDGADLRGMNVGVTADGPAVGDVAITTAVGFEVGEDVGSLAAELGLPYDPAAEYHRIPIEHGPELGPSEEPGMTNANAVVILGPQPGGAFLLRAPLNLGVSSP